MAEQRSTERTQRGDDGDTLVCAYCAQANGHSPRCSVTKFGVPEIKVPRAGYTGCPGCAHLAAERDRAVETRENANTVSVRVEIENRRLREALERIANITWPDNNPDKSMGELLGIAHYEAREALGE